MKHFITLLLFVLPFTAQAETAIFAGGCFWCMESEYEEVKGVSDVLSGYIGGTVENQSYEEVSSGTTEQVEAVKVTYDPAQVSYEKLLDIFWSNVDPTDDKGQFCDKGAQYRAGIFTQGEEQKKQAEASLVAQQKKYEQPLVAFIRVATPFYPAEAYHQNYAKEHALQYSLYRAGCLRDVRLKILRMK